MTKVCPSESCCLASAGAAVPAFNGPGVRPGAGGPCPARSPTPGRRRGACPGRLVPVQPTLHLLGPEGPDEAGLHRPHALGSEISPTPAHRPQQGGHPDPVHSIRVSPSPPATTDSAPDGSRTTSWAASQGICGWSQRNQASEPSGPRRVSETKSAPPASTSTVPSASTRTTSCTTSADVADSEWVSRTASTPSPSGTRSPQRTPAATAGSAVRATGCSPGTTRYSRWSVYSVNHTVPPATHQAPPPYSWTRVRAFQGAGSRSVVARRRCGGQGRCDPPPRDAPPPTRCHHRRIAPRPARPRQPPQAQR